MTRLLLRIGSALAGLLLPLAAAADYGVISGTVGNIGARLPTLYGESVCAGTASGFIALALGVVVRFRPLLTIIGVLVLSIFAVRMIVAQEDDVIAKARSVMTGLVAGLVLAWVVEPFVAAFYGCGGEVFRGDMATGVAVLGLQIGGIINWVLALIATIAVFMIVVSGVKAISHPGNEENIKAVRQTVVSVVVGILVLVFREFVVVSFLGSTLSPVPLLGGLVRLVGFFLGFLALAAVAVIIYDGITLVFNMGNEEAWGKTKGHLMRVAAGFVLILVSLALVNFVILPGVS